MGRIWKVIGSVLAVAVIGAFGFCTVWTIRNWDTVYQSLDGSSVYTNEDIKRTEQETWEKAAKNETEYQKTIAELRDLVTSLQVENAAFSDEVAALNVSISANESEIRQLTIRKLDLESQVAGLQETKIADDDLITELNTKIINLNNRISEISEISQNAAARIVALTNRCNELQASISKYETFISTQESSGQAIATYEVDGAVWKIEIVNKGEITLPQFTNTETIIFNGWIVSGSDTLLGNTYTINANTKFVASVVHRYTVQFMTDDVVYDNQHVVENGNATVPTAPTKTGYDFLGWSLNGVDIVDDINTTMVAENVTYHAVFAKIHTVTFMHGSQVVSSQEVRNGNYANDSNVVVETTGVFLGWRVNETVIDVSTYKILNNTIFIAVIDNNTWEEMIWNGFTPDYGSYIWKDNNNNIYYSYGNGNKHYKLNKSTNTWEKITWNGNGSWNSSMMYGSYVWKDNRNNIYYSNLDPYTNSYNLQFKLNESTCTWEEISWNGLNEIDGAHIWTDNDNNIYYSNGKDKQYKLNESTSTWEKMTWDGSNIYGDSVWLCGDEIYCSYVFTPLFGGSSVYYQYKLNKITNNWESTTWNIDISGKNVWQDNNNNLYHSSGKDKQYKLNESTNTWEEMIWNGFTPDYGLYIWKDNNNNIYYSYQYSTNKQLVKSVG